MQSPQAVAGRRTTPFLVVILLLLLSALMPSPAFADGITYVVRRGDTLATIAAAHGTTPAAIARANGLKNPDLIWVGQKLIIPSSSTAPKTPAGPAVASTGSQAPTRFVVSISQQHCWLYQNQRLTGSWPCSTGRRGYGTLTGVFKVRSKMPAAWGSRWGFYMPYWLGIYMVGSTENGIHGLPYNQYGKSWGNLIGTPISFGCVVLQDAAAKQLYDVAYIGMPVIIQW